MRIKEITSTSNATFKSLESLTHAKGIKKEKQILISGRKVVPEILREFDKGMLTLIFSEKLQTEAEALAQEHSVTEGLLLHNELFKSLDESGTKFPLLKMGTPEVEPYVSSQKGLNVFLALSDPSNLGAALRSLKAFEVAQVILLKECAHPYLPKVTKTASGVNLFMDLKKGTSIEDLHLDSLIALDMDGENLKNFSWPESANLVLGEEGLGLPTRLKNHAQRLKIEMSPEVESLSAPIALSIACYSFRTQKP